MAASSLRGWCRNIRVRAHENIFERLGGLARAAGLIGLGNSVRAIGFAVRRDRLDARALGKQAAGVEPRSLGVEPRRPGPADSSEPIDGGVRVSFAGGAVLELRLLRDGGAFVAWGHPETAQAPGPLPSYALVEGTDPVFAEGVRLEDAPGGGRIVVGARLRVEIGELGGLTFRSAHDGSVVRRDAPPSWPGNGRSWVHRSLLEPDAVVLGLGGRSTPLDRRPGSYRLWNTEPGGTYARGDDPLSLNFPVYVVAGDSGCQLAFYDDTFDGTVEVDGPDEPAGAITMRLTDGPLRYYVFAGTPERLLERYTALTGRPALVPRWALGYHQSRWGLGSERAMRELVEGFASRGLPLSAVWMDIDHLVNHSVFTVDERRYPDLAGFTRGLAERDVHVVAIIDPAVPRSRRVQAYDSGIAAGVFCRDARGDLARGVVWPGPTVYPDFTAPHARDWWGRLYETYVRLGVDGFWHDMNEPSAFAAFGDPTLPLSTRHDLDGRGGDHREAHNVYGLLMNRAARDGVVRLRPGRRAFMISRSGWAGLQRYGGTWSGDIGTAWESLAVSLAFTLGLGMTGIGYSGPDIGGFDSHPPAQLYVRWFQLGAYLPFFRTHSRADIPSREPWEWGPQEYRVIVDALRERYALLPYWYTLAHETHRTGAPYVRPLLWADPADRELRVVEDAFLLGDALLVAPVLEPDRSVRPVRLPAGRWYDRRTGRAYAGPGEVTLPADLADPVTSGTPVLVRAGSVLPIAGPDGIELEAWAPGPPGLDAGPETGPETGPEPGGRLITDAGDGFEPPTEERFTILREPDGSLAIRYAGPADELPYPVRWHGVPE